MKEYLSFEDREFLIENNIEDDRNSGSEAYWRVPNTPELFRMLKFGDVVSISSVRPIFIETTDKESLTELYGTEDLPWEREED